MNEMTDTPALDRLPLLPRDREGPVFAEAWQAQAFAMTVELSRQGRFTWSEWAQALAAEIAAAQARGDADLGDTYYHHWLAALERLVAAKDLVGASDLAARKEAWREAAAHTEFGQPIVLDRDRAAYA
jgi:nitrile hydratase accessory protein